jgi:hypothetical protein
MHIGDLVCWKTLTNSPAFKDIGIVLSLETSDSPYVMFDIVVEVYFMRIGHLWCAPDYLEVVSSYNRS